MLENCRRVCVIGAGTMGSGIAAHLANLGFDVTLLEQTREMAEEKLAQAASLRPPHFYLSGTSKTIRTGSIADDLDAVEQADWVCEAIIEKLDAKQALFETLDPLIRKDALISTNTSGLQISLLTEGRSDEFRRKFLGTHFFNPPRYLKLLELIPTSETDPAVVEATTKFFHDKAARRVVVVKDTPGFIANRYGMWSMFHAIHVAEKLRLSIEQVDAITGPFLGRPKSGSFRLNDLVGLDIMQDIAQNLIERCPHDPGTKQLETPKSMDYLMEKGWIGNKTRQGYYKKEGNQFVAFDLERHTYNEVQDPELPTLKELERLPLGERLKAALQDRSEVGEFLRLYLKPALQYAVSIKEEISHNVRDFDRVMQWGFGWQEGPFAMIDAIGAENLDLESKPFYQAGQIQDNVGTYFTPKPEPEFSVITDYPIVDQQPGFNVRDMGDGVEAVSITNKMGVIDPTLVRSLLAYLESGKLGRIVLTSEAKVFSAGFDLKFFNSAVEAEQFDEIESAIADFQKLNTMIGNIPSVAAVWGFCIGGGFELAAGCSLIAAHPETQIGLPEALVGLVPGGAGIGVMRLRMQSNGTKGIVEAAKLIATGGLSTNADDARKMGFLRDEDITVYHPDRLLTEAKKLALAANPLVRPAWQEVGGPIKGMIDQMQKELITGGSFSEYDAQINDKVKNVLTSATSFNDAVERERHAFVELCKEGRSHARMKHMVDTGKPLRN
ncbi:MAG: 3-hydroxyacyl-CoA dehydrogenase/enoyl-CoA hydratase family protein [Fimbriimonadaceae bacterium]|nr:3-hydroxyacyl-CoA dehydrogenase/enoyl-CoA hydratase family protein [Fimbriimonadaceae bacterium]